MAAFLRFTQFIQKTFALWVIVFAVLALWQPEFLSGSKRTFHGFWALLCLVWE